MLDVIMPVYNEARSISAAVQDVLEKVPGSRLLVVDDGSRDCTPQILDELEKKNSPRMKVFHKMNSGHGPAVYFGLEKSEAPWLFLIDSDSQCEVGDFAKLWEKRNEADILVGKRIVRHDPWIRIWLTRVIRYFLRLSFGVNIYDANVPFKLIKRPVWEKVKSYIPPDTIAPSLFIAVAAKKLGFRLAEVEIRHHPRRAGESSLKGRKLLAFLLKAFRQLREFRTRLNGAVQ